MRTFISIKWNCLSDYNLVLRIYQYWELILPQQIKLQIKSLVVSRIDSLISQYTYNTTRVKQPSLYTISKLITTHYPKIISQTNLQIIFKEKVRQFYLKSKFAKLNLAKRQDQFIQNLQLWRTNKKIFDELQLTLIIPKITAYIHQMEICPSDQNIAPMQTLFKCTKAGILSYDSCLQIIVNQFFPKWLKILKQWMQQRESRVKQQIAVWFKGWRGYLIKNLVGDQLQLTSSLKINSRLQMHLRMGLLIIKTNA